MRSLTFLALAALAAPAFAFGPVPPPAPVPSNGNMDSAKINVTAKIVAPVKIITVGSVDFGTLVVDDLDTAATAVLNSNVETAATTVKGQHCTPYIKSVKPTSATVHIQRESGLEYNIQIAPAKIGATTFTPVVPKSGTACEYPFPSKGTNTTQEHFNIEGTLAIPAGVTGVQTGQINVIVSYI